MAVCGVLAAASCARAAASAVRMRAEKTSDTGASRRVASFQMLTGGLLSAMAVAGPAEAEEVETINGEKIENTLKTSTAENSNSNPAAPGTKAPTVAVPPRIQEDPYALIEISNPDDKTANDFFEMKKQYKEDTRQVIAHMKISGSLDKGTPNMERWNKRVKEEMDDWLALYRRQDQFRGKNSFTTLYTAVDALASHIISYGPKFPFPNKRRPRLFQLINLTEKYLEKGK